MWLPSDDDIRALHERLAPDTDAFERVWTHCRIVCRIAEQLAPPGLDLALLRAGCLLHDVGVHRLAPGEAYIRHGVLGHEALAAEGYPEELARFCSHHTGVGLTRADVEEQHLPVPSRDYLPRNGEERLTMYADKFHSKRRPPVFLTYETYAREELAKRGPDKAHAFAALRTEFGLPDLSTLVAEFGHRTI